MEKDALAGYSGGAPYGRSMFTDSAAFTSGAAGPEHGDLSRLVPRPLSPTRPPGPTVDPALGPGPIGAVESNPLYHLDHKSLNSP